MTSYDSFGATAQPPSSQGPPRFTFTGREWTRPGLWQLRLRLYDPWTGRFYSTHPVGFLAHKGNAYSYVANPPISAVDRTGAVPFAPAAGLSTLVGAVAGAVAYSQTADWLHALTIGTLTAAGATVVPYVGSAPGTVCRHRCFPCLPWHHPVRGYRLPRKNNQQVKNKLFRIGGPILVRAFTTALVARFLAAKSVPEGLLPLDLDVEKLSYMASFTLGRVFAVWFSSAKDVLADGVQRADRLAGERQKRLERELDWATEPRPAYLDKHPDGMKPRKR